jgi:cytoskeletal protein RodZ
LFKEVKALQTPGEILRSERQKKGLSVKDVEQATSIRSLYLTAIEEGNYSIVPGEVYLKGFIRNYANFLGLNGTQIVDLYRQSQNPAASAAPGDKSENGQPGSSTSIDSQKSRDSRDKTSPVKWLLILLIPAAAAAGYWWYSQMPQQLPPEVKNAKPAPSAPSNPAQPVQPVPPKPQVTPPAPVQSKPLAVTAKFIDECWTQVIADGKEVYEGIPNPGETLSWEAEQNITLTLGNASGVDISYNGKPQGKLGSKGEVVVKKFLPQQ